MNRKEFATYKRLFLRAIRASLFDVKSSSLDEAAFPAYAHKNPVISFLFWERLKKVMTFLEPLSPFDAVLDFGCGSGVMLPFLAKLSNRIIAIDNDISPLEKVRQYVSLPKNINSFDAHSIGKEKWFGF